VSRVAGYLLRRLISAAAVVLVMVTLTFATFWSVPSQPAQFVYPSAQHLSSYQVEKGDKLLGTDRPGIVQYADYLWHLVRGDLGHTWSGAHITARQTLESPAVAPMLVDATRVTLSILLGGLLLVVLVAVPLGALAARHVGTGVDRTITFLTLAGICTHPMVVGLLLRTVFADRLGWLPPNGYCNLFNGAQSAGLPTPSTVESVPCHGLGPWAEHLLLPWLSFALLFLALYTRVMRANVIRELSEDYVRTARAKGATETRVIRSHVLPNALLPLLTLTGIEVGTALGIAVYIESVFGFPGLGRLSVTVLVGTIGLDLPMILGTIVFITLVVVVANLVVDALYVFVDPRVSAGESRSRREGTTGGVL